jgi:hypothetical protein
MKCYYQRRPMFTAVQFRNEKYLDGIRELLAPKAIDYSEEANAPARAVIHLADGKAITVTSGDMVVLDGEDQVSVMNRREFDEQFEPVRSGA